MAPYVSVNSSAFCDLTKQEKGSDQASARFQRARRFGSLRRGRRWRRGRRRTCGGRERRHPRAGGDRPGGDRGAAEPARVVLLPATPEQADQKSPRTQTPVDLASDPGGKGNGAHLLNAPAGTAPEAVCADRIVAAMERSEIFPLLK
jgi:hypothetical protein